MRRSSLRRGCPGPAQAIVHHQTFHRFSLRRSRPPPGKLEHCYTVTRSLKSSHRSTKVSVIVFVLLDNNFLSAVVPDSHQASNNLTLHDSLPANVCLSISEMFVSTESSLMSCNSQHSTPCLRLVTVRALLLLVPLRDRAQHSPRPSQVTHAPNPRLHPHPLFKIKGFPFPFECTTPYLTSKSQRKNSFNPNIIGVKYSLIV